MDVGKKLVILVGALILLFYVPVSVPRVCSDSSISLDTTLNFSEETVKK